MGPLLQALVIIVSLSSTALLASKRWVRWGYLVGFLSIFCWATMEGYYRQWLMLSLNPLYTVMWIIGLYNHWQK